MDITLCEHRFGNGSLCRNFALHGEQFCRHHLRYKDKPDITSPDYQMPQLEDLESIQLFLNEAIRGLLSGKLDSKQGRCLVWAALVASSNLKALSKQKLSDVVLNLKESPSSEVIESLRGLIIGAGPHTGRTIGEVLDAKLAKIAIQRGTAW